MRFGLTSPDAGRLVHFYEVALGARRLTEHRLEGDEFERTMEVDGGAQRRRIAFGDQLIDILEFDQAGEPYPADHSPLNVTFQHFALVVGDMDLALDRLGRRSEWTAITTGGPQHLPDRSGGVTAFKFRDPDGHPLEFLAFPADRTPVHWRTRLQAGAVCGIDHSAISIADTERSAEYFQSLGFRPTGHGVNAGKRQEHLDGISRPRVEVTAMSAEIPTPHLEFLCYESESSRGPALLRSNDVAATRLILGTGASTQLTVQTGESLIRDPDGHHLLLAP